MSSRSKRSNDKISECIEYVENVSICQEKANRKRVMVFDTETTGLITKSKAGVYPVSLDQQPHILQLSFVIYDIDTWKIEKSTDLFIKIDPSVFISEKITELTGITHEICDTKGVSIEEALTEFYHEYIKCGYIVAHNLDFDRDIILIEIQRLLTPPRGQSVEIKWKAKQPNWYCVFNTVYENLTEKKMFCTMKLGKAVCNIENVTATRKYLKPPKLAELYHHLFGEGSAPNGLHNALIDTYVCLRCFIKLKFGFEAKLDIFPEGTMTPRFA
jgi:hypothetical protein